MKGRNLYEYLASAIVLKDSRWVKTFRTGVEEVVAGG